MYLVDKYMSRLLGIVCVEDVMKNTVLRNVLVVGLFGLALTSVKAWQTPSVPPELDELNKVFRTSYAARREISKTASGLVIVVSGSSLILYDKGKEIDRARVIPDQFQILRVFAHLPFGIFLQCRTLQEDGDNNLTSAEKTSFEDYLAKLEKVEKLIGTLGLSLGQVKRQELIVNKSRQFVTSMIASGKCDPTVLLSFAKEIGSAMVEDADDAAVAQIAGTHNQVLKWKTKYQSQDWAKFGVIIRGKQMARRYNVATQYFARLARVVGDDLGYPGEGQRIVYYESPFNDTDLDLYATVQIDGEASQAFFGDRLRLSRDILADGAKTFLDSMNFDQPVKFP
jgi:hypothetical protein